MTCLNKLVIQLLFLVIHEKGVKALFQTELAKHF